MSELIRLDPRGRPSPFWTYASPVLAIVLTILVTGVMFFAHGQAAGRGGLHVSHRAAGSRPAACRRSRSRRRR